MNALCAKLTLEDCNAWPAPYPGGNELSHSLDRYHDNWDKIGLNFTPYTPMAYRKKPERHICFFIVKPEVAAWEGVMFTDINATSTSHSRGEGLDGLDLVRLDVMRQQPRGWDREGWVLPVQAEILVPKAIPLEYVDKVVFVSKASLAEGLRLWGSSEHLRFEEAPSYFADGPGSISPFGFSYVVELVLTPERVDKDNVSQHHWPHRTRFVWKNDGRLTAVASVYALAGTTARVKWEPAGIETTTQFETSNEYWHWRSVSMEKLPVGQCWVEYYLNEIRWARIDFELTAR